MKKFSNRLVIFLLLAFSLSSYGLNDITQEHGVAVGKKGIPVRIFEESSWSVQSDMVRPLGNDCYEINVRVYNLYEGTSYLVANSNVLVGDCPKSSNLSFERNENCDSGVLQNGDSVIFDLKGSTTCLVETFKNDAIYNLYVESVKLTKANFKKE